MLVEALWKERDEVGKDFTLIVFLASTDFLHAEAKLDAFSHTQQHRNSIHDSLVPGLVSETRHILEQIINVENAALTLVEQEGLSKS